MALTDFKPTSLNIDFKDDIKGTEITFSSELLNYVEPVNINGINKTKFITKYYTNFKVGDKVYVVGGNYDTNTIITKSPFAKNANGYKVLSVNTCEIILDIDYTAIKPYDELSLKDTIKLFTVNTQDEFDYYTNIFITQKSGAYAPYNITSPLPIKSYPRNRFQNVHNNILFINTTVTVGLTTLTQGFYKCTYSNSGVTWVNISSNFMIGSYGAYIDPTITPSYKYVVSMDSDITYSGTTFLKDVYYKYNTTTSKYESGITTKTAFITKANFRSGTFNSQWNDGVYGQYATKIDWNGSNSEWFNGVFLNSNWNAGKMDSKTDTLSLKFKNYYGKIENGLPKIDTDLSNNLTYGYNYSTLSYFKNGTLNNGVFVKNKIGDSTSVSNALENYYISPTASIPQTIQINGGNYIDNEANNVEFNNSTVSSSYIDNITFNNSTLTNNYITRSVLKSSTINNTDTIKIVNYETFDLVDENKFGYMRTYRFYINSNDAVKVKYGKKIFLKNIVITDNISSGNIFTMFDEGFYIGDYAYNNDDLSGDTQRINTSLKYDWENNYSYKEPLINVVSVTYSVYYTKNSTVNNINKYACVDISFYLDPKETEQVSIDNNIINKLPKFNINVLNAYLVTSDIDKSVITDNSILKSAIITNTEDYNTEIQPSTGIINGITSTGTILNPQLTINLDTAFGYDAWKYNKPKVNDLIWLNNIYYYLSGTYHDLSSQYKVVTVNDHQIVIENYYSTTLNIVNTAGGDFMCKNNFTSEYTAEFNSYKIIPTFTYIDTVQIEDSTIEKGVYSKVNFKDSTIDNTVTNTSEKIISINNIQQLKINRFKNYDNSNIIKSGLWYNSIFSSSNINKALIYESAFVDNSTFNDGCLNKSLTLDATINGGILYDINNTLVDKTDIFNYIQNSTDIYYVVSICTLNNGLYEKVTSITSTMNNGKFTNSTFIGGTINNGVIGDTNTPNENTLVYSTVVNNANVYSGLIGVRNDILTFPTVINNITLNGGKIVGNSIIIPIQPTIVYNAIVNKGEIGGDIPETNYVKWVNGSLNDGLFNSHYGDGISTYSWMAGTMSGGTFATQSTWYDGIMTGGIFKGKIWNNGKMIGGKFIGSGNSSLLSTPQQYINSFTASPSLNTYYGLWRNGVIVDTANKLSADADTDYYNVKQKLINDGKLTLTTTEFNNAVFMGGTISHTNFYINDSLFVSGEFYNGKFNNSNFNPYVTRYISGSTSFSLTQSYDLYDTTRWYNGEFLNGYMQISEFDKGIIQNGTFNSIRFNDGVVNYATFYNSIFAAGQWRNGNWYGSEYIVYDSASASRSLCDASGNVKDGRRKDELIKQMIRKGTASVHLWNAFKQGMTDYAFEPGYNVPINNSLISLNSTTPVGSFTYSMPLSLSYLGIPSNYFSRTGAFSETGLSSTALVYTKLGNAEFDKGVWEAGVWNSGYKYDRHSINLDDVSYVKVSDNSWNITITGATFSGYKKGDIITVGNIIAVDINENRKLIKDSFKIISDVNETMDTSLTFSWITTFPVRRIEKDSSNHKIKVTKNVWLNGGLLNGRFLNTVWNNGILRGSNHITRIDNSQIVDANIITGYIYGTQSTSVNNNYATYSTATYSTILIQNMLFDMRTILAVTPYNSSTYNTVMDINYSKDSYSTVANEKNWSIYVSPFSFAGGYSTQSVTGGNITYDVLSSISNIYDPLYSAYIDGSLKTPYKNTLNLGVKYKKYDNYLGDDGTFNVNNISDLPNYTFNNTYISINMWGQPYSSYIKPLLYGTVSINNTNLSIQTSATMSSEYAITITNNKFNNIPKNRYIIYEYDLVKGNPSILTSGLYSIGNNNTDGNAILGVSYSVFNQAKVLNPHKVEYFYNPITLEGNNRFYTHIAGTSTSPVNIDNIKFTEIDMMPFYDYRTTAYARRDERIKIPLVATSPFIDYTDNQYSFIDNIIFKFDSVTTTNDF